MCRINGFERYLEEAAGATRSNCGRVRGAFKYHIQQSSLKFRWNLNAKIDATAASIRQALQKGMEMK